MDRIQGPVTHLSLCSGYEGISLGLSRVVRDLRTITACEIEAFAVANLAAKMEAGLLDTAPVWTDLKTLPFARFHGLVDILSGGFPCQPFSAAGLRGGDEDPRHLFPFILRGITECRPRCVFLENVEGIISAKLRGTHWRDPEGTPVLLHVLRELERVGYRATAGVFSSAEVGAPHQRKRVFILGLGDGTGLEGWVQGILCQCARERTLGSSDPSTRVARPMGRGTEQYWWEPTRVVADDKGNRRRPRRAEHEGQQGRDDAPECGSTPLANPESRGTDAGEQQGSICGTEQSGTASVADTTSTRLVQREEAEREAESGGRSPHSSMGYTPSLFGDVGDNQPGASERPQEVSQSGDASRKTSVGDTSCQLHGRSRDRPGGDGHAQSPNAGIRQAQPSLGRDPDGRPDRLDYAQLCSSVDSRADELRLLGNGVDPDVVAKAFVTLLRRFLPS